MGHSLEVLAGVYKDEEQATRILDVLKLMHKESTITLDDLAMVTKGDDNKVHVHETRELTAKKGAIRGAIVTGIFGIIYPPSLIATVVVGGGVGALWGRLRDTGVKMDTMKDIGHEMKPGEAGVIALCEPEWAAEVERALGAEPGSKVVRHALTEEETEHIEKAVAEHS